MEMPFGAHAFFAITGMIDDLATRLRQSVFCHHICEVLRLYNFVAGEL